VNASAVAVNFITADNGLRSNCPVEAELRDAANGTSLHLGYSTLYRGARRLSYHHVTLGSLTERADYSYRIRVANRSAVPVPFKRTTGIKWCSGGSAGGNFDPGNAFGHGTDGICPILPAGLDKDQKVALCEQVCAAPNASACAGFTWYPGRDNTGICCFRTNTASKPPDPAGTAECHEKDIPVPARVGSSVAGSCSVERNGTRFALHGAWSSPVLRQGTDPSEQTQVPSTDTATPCTHPDNVDAALMRTFAHGCCKDGVNKYTGSTAPHFCRLAPDATASSFLEAADGKHVLFVGDSLTMQVYVGTVLTLKAGHGVKVTKIAGGFRVESGPLSAVLSLLQVYAFRAVNHSSTKWPKYFYEGWAQGYLVSHEVLQHSVQHADVVIANMGAHDGGHGTPDHNYPAYMVKQMEYLQGVVNAESVSRSRTGHQPICFLWRSTLPTHFNNAKGSGLFHEKGVAQGTPCAPLRVPFKQMSDGMIENTRLRGHANTGADVPLIYVTSLLQNASMFHGRDCRHYCYTPQIFQPITLLIAASLRASCFLEQRNVFGFAGAQEAEHHDRGTGRKDGHRDGKAGDRQRQNEEGP
jgi:hypothetical protein